jgi:hypothetical protein
MVNTIRLDNVMAQRKLCRQSDEHGRKAHSHASTVQRHLLSSCLRAAACRQYSRDGVHHLVIAYGRPAFTALICWTRKEVAGCGFCTHARMTYGVLRKRVCAVLRELPSFIPSERTCSGKHACEEGRDASLDGLRGRIGL